MDSIDEPVNDDHSTLISATVEEMSSSTTNLVDASADVSAISPDRGAIVTPANDVVFGGEEQKQQQKQQQQQQQQQHQQQQQQQP